MFRRIVFSNPINRIRHCSTINSEHSIIIENVNIITLIGINNPTKKNSLTLNIIEKIKKAIVDFESSDSKIAILYGVGGNFSSGFDIDEIINHGYHKFSKITEDFNSGLICKKPTIAAINGYAVAEGFELALACDLRVIEDTACMGFLGKRFGVPLGLGGESRLTTLIGVSRAMQLVLTGHKINGITADNWGLAARLVSTGTALGQAICLATEVGKYTLSSTLYDRYNILKHSMNESKIKNIYSNDDINAIKETMFKEIKNNLPRFHEGIGKHGKSKNILKKEIPIWDYEEAK